MWDLGRFGGKTALLDDSGNEMTYQGLESFGERFSSSMPGRSLVFVLCTNTIGSIAGYVSLINSRNVALLVNSEIDRDLLAHLMENYSPGYIWAPDGHVPEFGGCKPVFSEMGYTLLDTGNGPYEIYDELALLLTTSGSTGSPKFVRQSYTNIHSNAESIASYLELDEGERPITTLPMNYTYGLSIINSHLLVGATILVTQSTLVQKEFWDFLKEKEATSFGGVPYTYEMLDRLRIYRMDIPSIRTMTQAGGRLSPELHAKYARYAKDNGKQFIVMYGQCEATARMSYLPDKDSIDKCGSIGIAIPGGAFEITDVSGNSIKEPDVAGELVYRGPNVTLGYAEGASDLKKGDEFRGVLHTGDVARFDEDGYLYIVGRMKRFLKVYGNRVNLDEIDSMVKARFGNIDCASSGVDDHVFIFVTDPSLQADVKEFVVSKTKLNQAAFKVVVIDDIPKSDSGKIQYSELSKYM